MYKAIVAAKENNKIVEKESRPLKDNEARLKMEVCGVCHTDLHVKNADFGDVSGCTLGHEGIGIVTEVGKDVTSLKLVIVHLLHGFMKAAGIANIVLWSRNALSFSKNAGYTVDGAMAEECIVTDGYAVKVPENLASEPASSITCAGVTTYKAIKESGIRPGQWLMISGLGGLGNLALQYAKHVFNAKVVAVDVNDNQLAFAKEMGADLLINPVKDPDFAAQLQKEIGGVHAAVVTAVAKSAFNGAVDAVRAGGTVVAVGLPVETMDLSIPRLVLDGIHVVGSLVGTRQDLREAFTVQKEKLFLFVKHVNQKKLMLFLKKWNKEKFAGAWSLIFAVNLVFSDSLI